MELQAQIATLQAQIVQRQRMINILTQMITLQDKARDVQKEMDKEPSNKRRMENESKEGESAKKKRRIGSKEENDGSDGSDEENDEEDLFYGLMRSIRCDLNQLCDLDEAAHILSGVIGK